MNILKIIQALPLKLSHAGIKYPTFFLHYFKENANRP